VTDQSPHCLQPETRDLHASVKGPRRNLIPHSITTPR
jgi:hypothetical protein